MIKPSNTRLSSLFSVFLLSTLFIIHPHSANAKEFVQSSAVKLATTTSTENSGLLNALLPEFEKDTGYKVHTIAVGTGKALRMGRDGDVDALLVHAKDAELAFMARGDGEKRYDVMHNDFVIVGPKDDPAHVTEAKNAAQALEKIAAGKRLFISRGDDSGTHKKELGVWKNTKINPKKQGVNWYREAGQGMGKVLQMAGEMDAYTLTDRGTWLAFKKKSPLKIVFEGDPVLFNPYGIIAVSSTKYPDINIKGAKALMEWITSKKGQHLIGSFKVAGKVLFTPDAAATAKVNLKTP